MKISKLTVAAMGMLLCVAGATSAMAQAQPGGQPGQPGQPGGRGNRGNFDPAQARERMLTRIKEQLGASDDEWKALQPAVEKVMTAQRDARAGGRGGAGGPGGPGGRGGRRGGQGGAGGAPAADAAQPAPPQQPQTEVAKAAAALQAAVDNKDTSPAELDQKLAALRDAKAKAREQLSAAQKELKDLLTRRQEAVLVTNGMLE